MPLADKIEVSWAKTSKKSLLPFHLSDTIAMYVFHSKLLSVFTVPILQCEAGGTADISDSVF